MDSFLYHGTYNIEPIIKTNSLMCMSYPEYDLDVDCSVLSLTRSWRFAKYYCSMERDPPFNPAIIWINKEILKQNYKIYLGRSTIFDNCKFKINREECEEFLIKSLSLNHPSIIKIQKFFI